MRVAPVHLEAQPLDRNGSAPGAVFKPTDLGNAERLVAWHGDDLRFVPGFGWHAWDGRRWRPDKDGEVMRRAKASARAILGEAQSIEDDSQRKVIVKWAMESERMQRLRAAIELAESEQPIIARPDDLDADPYLLNVANGTIDLRTGELRDHNRSELNTLLSDIPFDAGATCPRFEKFLREIFAGDVELIAFIQRFVGYCLTGDTREEVLGVLHGTGCNGKSTLLSVVQDLLGEYAITSSFEAFMRARSDRGPRDDLARLHRARLVTAAESGEGRRLDEATVKQITGGDVIAARFLYGEHFEFTPKFKLVLVTNRKPKVDGTDDALWRRLRLVPFEQSFEGHENRQLGGALKAELPGILAWAVRGYRSWERRGLGQAEAVKAATREYRQEEDHLSAFLDAKCVREGHVEAARLRDAYASYCHEVGEKPLAPSTLGVLLRGKGIVKKGRPAIYQVVSLR